jgi:hypothetical protein
MQPEINTVLTDVIFRYFSFLSSFILTGAQDGTSEILCGKKSFFFICNLESIESGGEKEIVLLVR